MEAGGTGRRAGKGRNLEEGGTKVERGGKEAVRARSQNKSPRGFLPRTERAAASQLRAHLGIPISAARDVDQLLSQTLPT